MEIGFDIISDLNLDADDEFDWEGKPTSLYLIIAGNISNDLRKVHQTLYHLSKLYQGIFYVSGSLEHESMHFVKNRHKELAKLCKTLNNVAYLHKHVVIINGIALLGCSGWYGTRTEFSDDLEKLHYIAQNVEDGHYLIASINKLTLHLDVTKIIVITNSPPGLDLFFGEQPYNLSEYVALNDALVNDSETKVTHWIYGSYNKNVDTNIDGVTYINNASFKQNPYWPKRLNVEV